MIKSLFFIASLFMFLSCKKEEVETAITPTNTPFTFKSTAFTDNGTLPKEYTCNGASTSPPLNWENLPTGTKSVAITMHHIPPEMVKHVYLMLYNIPVGTTSIPANVSGVGKFGINSVNGKNTYSPPCSQGPGAKTYILTAYALSAEPVITTAASATTMDVFLTAIKSTTLGTSTLTVTYTRP